MTVTEQTQEWKNIDYTKTSAYLTSKAFGKEGITWKIGDAPSGMNIGGIPDAEFTQLKRLRKIDSIIVPKNGPVEKIITSLMRQVVRQPDPKERNKVVQKEYLTIRGQFKAYDFAGMEIGMEFHEGVHKKPVMGKVYRTSKRFDSETGEDLGKIEVRRVVDEYTIELPKDVTKRKKLIDDIIENANGTYPENIHYYYKNAMGIRDDTFDYNQFTNLSIEDLTDFNKKGGGSKGPGYWRDKDNKLRDKDGKLIGQG
jgi:hypothetical protein